MHILYKGNMVKLQLKYCISFPIYSFGVLETDNLLALLTAKMNQRRSQEKSGHFTSPNSSIIRCPVMIEAMAQGSQSCGLW